MKRVLNGYFVRILINIAFIQFVFCSHSSRVFAQTIQTYTVSTLNDNINNVPANSLRAFMQTISTCTSCADEYIINFSVAGTINLVAKLPEMSKKKITINGTTAPNYNGVPLVNIQSVTSTPIDYFFKLSGTNVNGSIIKGLKLSGNAKYAIHVNTVNNILIEKNLFIQPVFSSGSFQYRGIQIESCKNGNILNNTIENGYFGIYLTGSTSNKTETFLIKENIIKKSYALGISLEGTYDIINSNSVEQTNAVQFITISKNLLFDFDMYAIRLGTQNNSKPNPDFQGATFKNNILTCYGTSQTVGDKIEIFTSRYQYNKNTPEALTYLGYAIADANKNWTFSISSHSIPNNTTPTPFEYLTGTATDPNGNTSYILEKIDVEPVEVCSPRLYITADNSCSNTTTLCAPEGMLSYQWEKNNVVISGTAAQQRCFTIPQGGQQSNYRVKVSQPSGCPDIYSDPVYIY